MSEGEVEICPLIECGTVLDYYKCVYNLMESEYRCITCFGCRLQVKDKCLAHDIPLCLKWVCEELTIPYHSLDEFEDFWVVEIVHRIARRLIGFAIAEMCLEGSK